MSISDDQLKQICQRALTVRERAFAPYSNFLVGSALLSTSGQIYVGCNVENVSYGLTLCAERSAIAAMVASGEQKAVAIAIASQGGVTPCGACRQVMHELMSSESLVLSCCDSEHVLRWEPSQYLPDPFVPDALLK